MKSYILPLSQRAAQEVLAVIVTLCLQRERMLESVEVLSLGFE